MQDRYIDLISQTFDFPQPEFRVEGDQLLYHDVPLMDLIREHGSPLRMTYIPQIGGQIDKARKWFQDAMAGLNYNGRYTYCYCTKSSHYAFVIEEALAHGAQLETSSEFDLDLILRLLERGKIDKKTAIVCNGFKTEGYGRKICELVNAGFENLIPVLDNLNELTIYEQGIRRPTNLGIRIAAEEEPNFEFYTSRLGIRHRDIVPLYKQRIHESEHLNLSMLHFFINTGIRDTTYYWSELRKSLDLYTQLRKECPDLHILNIGGGLPIKNSLGFEYDYEYMIGEILAQALDACLSETVPEPDIYSEFGKFTVGESGALLHQVLDQKWQNDRELWYMIDGSLMTTLPDTWGIGERFVLLPLNKWNNPYQRVNIGGLSCDQYDYYNAEVHLNQVMLPKPDNDGPLFVGFFHMGAYQDSLSGVGGLKHCLIPSPKHVLVDRHGADLSSRVFMEQQSASSLLQQLGYGSSGQ